MTQTQLAAKRHERTMTQREKRRNRIRAATQETQNTARRRASQATWLAELGHQHRTAAKALEDAQHQHHATRPGKLIKPSFWGKVAAYFKPRGR